jgi:hypothetical protein
LNKKINNNNNQILPPIVNCKKYHSEIYIDSQNKEWVIKKNIITNQERKFEIKPKRNCANAHEYFSQFSNAQEKYDLREIKVGLKKVSNILKNYDIFLVHTGWDSVWENSYYSSDRAEEIIFKKNSNLIKERFERYKKFVIGNKNKFYDIPLIYIKELVSFVVISDHQLYLSKQSGFLFIQTNFINNSEKNICIKIFKEIFPYRLSIRDEQFIIKLYPNI